MSLISEPHWLTLPALGQGPARAAFPQPMDRTWVSCSQRSLEVSANPRKSRVRSSWEPFLPPYLDDKIHVALVLITGDGSVWPDDQAAIDSGREIDVSPWGPCRELRKGCLLLCCVPITFQKPQGGWRKQRHLASHCSPSELPGRDNSPLSHQLAPS